MRMNKLLHILLALPWTLNIIKFMTSNTFSRSWFWLPLPFGGHRKCICHSIVNIGPGPSFCGSNRVHGLTLTVKSNLVLHSIILPTHQVWSLVRIEVSRQQFTPSFHTEPNEVWVINRGLQKYTYFWAYMVSQQFRQMWQNSCLLQSNSIRIEFI